MSLRRKLLWAQAPLGLALVVVSFLFLRTMGVLGVESQSILKDNFRSVLAGQRIKDALDTLEDSATARALRMETDPSAESRSAREALERELHVQETNITEPGEAAATAQLRVAWDRCNESLRALDAGGDPLSLYALHLRPQLEAVRRAADLVLALNLDAIVHKNDAVRKVISHNETLVFAATLAACLLGLFASGALTAQLLRPLGVLSQTVRRVGEGDLNARISIEGADEIATLAREFNAMTARMQSYRQSSLGELLEAQAAAQATLDSLSDPVVVFDAQGGLLNVNEAAEGMLGLSVEHGNAGLTTLDPGLAAALEKTRAFVLAGHGPYVPKGFDEAVSAFTSDGQRYFLTRANPVYSTEAGIAGVTVVFQDVTRVRLFDELQNDLVATVAHEFRTPLTSLRMAVHLCIDGTAGTLTEKQSDLLYGAREDTERLQAMVDDLLDVARMQAGQAGLQKRAIPVGALLDGVIAAHREEAREHGLVLRAEPAPEGLVLEVDPERLSLVFNNLVTNALQHTPAGGTVDLRARPRDGFLHFEITDTGPGIPKQYQARVFDKFFQIPGRAGGAAGLGLYICKEVIRAHGGELGLSSEPGQGTTFWFDLPA